MDMVNDGKDIRLDTPQAVKEALASGKDLYNPQTGEFWWEYNYTGSIANTNVQLDDPNLLAAIDNPDFDLYEDIVGGLNYTGYITDSIETIIEDGEENAPLIDPRDEVFAQIASEDGWVIASPENVRKAVQVHMAENGADAPGKENDMDKPISDYRKRPQGMSLKQAVREAREASAKLAEENGGTDTPDGKAER